MVFRLRKKGPEAFLMSGGVHFEFSEEESGTYKGDSLFRGGRGFPMKTEELDNPKVYGEPVVCDLRAKATYHPKRKLWVVVIEPGNPEGGILVSDELLYEAPATGYQPGLTIQVPCKGPKDSNPNWGIETPSPGKYLYLRSRKEPIYSRINMENGFKTHFTTSSKDKKTLVQEMWFGGAAKTNPYGDRILEEATDLPGPLRLKLMDEIDEAHKRGVRPVAPDLEKRVAEWRRGGASSGDSKRRSN